MGAPDFLVRCLFVDAPNAPFLLGRADLLERFVLTIDASRRRILFEERP